MRPVVLCCSPTPVQASGFPVYSARLCLFMVTTFWGGYFLCVYAMLAVYSDGLYNHHISMCLQAACCFEQHCLLLEI